MKKGSDVNMSGFNDKALLIKNRPDEAKDFEATLSRFYDPESLKPKIDNQIRYVKTSHDDKMFCTFRLIEIVSKTKDNFISSIK
jgi:hypothetical protein